MKPKRNYKPGPMDNCQTPTYALSPLIRYLPLNSLLWESAAGEGYLVRALIALHYRVFATELEQGIDFFKQIEPIGDIQVTNPPYRLKFEWLKHSYELCEPFALLLPVETLGSKKAQTLFEHYGVEIILLDTRINFKMPAKGWSGQAQFPVAWFTSGLNIGRELTYAHINVVAKREWIKDHESL